MKIHQEKISYRRIVPFFKSQEKKEEKKRFSVVKYVFKQHDCRDKLRTNKFMRNKNF